MKNRADLCLLAAFAIAGAAGSARAADTPLGVWLDHTGRGAVEITECGKLLCGKVVWVSDAKNAKGCGLQIIGDVKRMSDGTFDEGWIYDPDKDAKFSVELVPQGDKLTVVGYAGIKFLSQSFVWTRAPSDLPRCQAG